MTAAPHPPGPVAPISAPTGRGSHDRLPAATILRHRIDGDHPVDEWGLDPELVDFFAPVVALRWRIRVDGAEHLPAVGPAMVVFNRHIGVSEAFVCARGLREATGRFIRPVGAPDVAVIGPALRRFGLVQSQPDEVTGLLRAGEVVAVPLQREVLHHRRAGAAPVDHLARALIAGVPVVPVAVVGWEAGRTWRLLVGEPLPEPAGRGPLGIGELAEAARTSIQGLIDRLAH